MKLTWVFILGVVSFAAAEPDYFLPRHGLPPPPPPKARARTPIWGNIVQKLNHFDTTDTRTWNMRYIYNSQFFRPGGPIFIMVGAEWTIDPGWLQTGQMYDMAEEHGGYMVYTEHRYYGKSYPTSDLSPANLRYLTTDLALADVSYFITYIKATVPELANSKVIIVGGSYGGNMAIWLREKYPQLVHAALSSSAPVLAKVDFQEYNQVVQNGLGASCSAVITAAINKIVELLQTSVGRMKVQTDFNLCRPIDPTDVLSIRYFFMMISSTFGGAIQYASSSTVPGICSRLQDPSIPSAYDSLVRYMSTQGCRPSYPDLVASMSNWGLNRGDSRQWTYQTCVQYGYFQTATAPNQPFGNTIPLSFFQQWCIDFFGPEFTPAVTQNGVATTNAVYGGLNPRVTRVVSTHGTVDPWHAIGLSKDLSSEAPVIIVNGASHCADLSSISGRDSQEMINAKLAVKDHIARWLAQ